MRLNAVYKTTSTIRVEIMRSRPRSSREPLEHSANSIITFILFNITQLDVELLSLRININQNRSLCASYLYDHLKT
jgi:hypothetical protein